MDYWPWNLLEPLKDRWTLKGVALQGGVNAGGNATASRTDGGGIWVGEQTFLLTDYDQMLAARAIEASLDGGVGAIVAWTFVDPFVPGELGGAHVPHSDGASFSDGSLYGSTPAGAIVVAACPLRATNIPIMMVSGALRGGEDFSIVHAVHGWRKYRVNRVFDGSVEIRPPLREAIEAGTEIHFLRVGVASRLLNPDEFFGAIDGNHAVEVTARWIEAFPGSGETF